MSTRLPGRPKLPEHEKRPPRFGKWQPTRWKPIYEKIIIMSAGGMSNKMIAASVGFTPEHVSSILNLPQAEQFRVQVLKIMRERALADVPATMSRIVQKGMNRLEKMVEDDGQFANAPFAILDRVFKVAENTGHFKKSAIPDQPNGSVSNTTNIIMSGNQLDKLVEAMEKSDQVKQLHGGRDISNLKQYNPLATKVG